jgi:Ser/Thr protein kinase RdoA (MazF antagonist)
MLSAADGDVIATVYGLGPAAELTGPVARGELGQIWRLTTDHGQWAVKEWFDPPDLVELEEGAAFQEAAALAGVPSPALLHANDGSSLTQLRGMAIRMQAWVDLLERDPLLDPVAVGGLVATLHRVPFAGLLPMHPWYIEPVGVDRWDELVVALREAGAPFAERLAEIRNGLVALEGLLVAPTNLRTCHRDLWADNVRATAEGNLCLIDWEDCGLADPSQELALVLFEFGRTDAARASALYAAYVDAGGPGRVDRPGDFSMPVAQLGHLGERACARWLSPSLSEVERARAADAFGEFSSEPLSREVIAMLLDAIHG